MEVQSGSHGEAKVGNQSNAKGDAKTCAQPLTPEKRADRLPLLPVFFVFFEGQRVVTPARAEADAALVAERS